MVARNQSLLEINGCQGKPQSKKPLGKAPAKGRSLFCHKGRRRAREAFKKPAGPCGPATFWQLPARPFFTSPSATACHSPVSKGLIWERGSPALWHRGFTSCPCTASSRREKGAPLSNSPSHSAWALARAFCYPRAPKASTTKSNASRPPCTASTGERPSSAPRTSRPMSFAALSAPLRKSGALQRLPHLQSSAKTAGQPGLGGRSRGASPPGP